MKQKHVLTACAVAACAALGSAGVRAQAQTTTTPAATPAPDSATDSSPKVIVTAKRVNRVSKGATGLPMEIKDTPQTISTIDVKEMADFGVTSSNDALSLATGVYVEKYETNRVAFNSRGFEIQLTQMDGLGMSNDWGVVVGNLDTFIFDRIELIRGANGLLTGVGNSSGTVNYVRKRPTNKDGGLAVLSGGSHSLGRVAVDYNKVLTQDGAWAGRIVVAHEDKESHLRGLHDKRTTVYGVVDGQIGDNGVLTLGFTHADSKQQSPMWGSLTLNYPDGRQADFPVGASTSQDWTYWNNRNQSAFIEYTHRLGTDWEAKVTYNRRTGDESTRLLYAYSLTGGLNNDNTGLVGWPYRSEGETTNDILDANVSGQFSAFGRRHSVIAGLSQSRQQADVDTYAADPAGMFLPLPAFPYNGNSYKEPGWGPRAPSTRGEQKLTRLYAATRIAVTDQLKGIVGVNAIKLEREGASIYGSAATANNYPKTEELSPYVGITYDITKDVLGYVSYSDIFQNQDQTDYNGAYLAPMKGVNTEAGVKAEWLDKRFLTTFAAFASQQNGLATFDGMTAGGAYAYVGKDVKSRGVEFEGTGRLGQDTKLTLGLTRLKLTGPDGKDIYEWVPRTTGNIRFDTRIAALPALRLGFGGRWQSETSKIGHARQGGYAVANAFASYEVTSAATLRLNVNNLFDRKYITGLAYGALYGTPRTAALTLEYKL